MELEIKLPEMDDLNKIKMEEKLATSVYQDFKSKKFGLTPCCYINMQDALIKKELCDWEELKAIVLTPSTEVDSSLVTCPT